MPGYLQLKGCLEKCDLFEIPLPLGAQMAYSAVKHPSTQAYELQEPALTVLSQNEASIRHSIL